MKNLNLNELTFENINEWPIALKYLSAVLVALLLIGIGYWFLIKPNIAEYNKLAKKEKELRQEFEKKQKLAVNLPAYRNQLQIMEERFGNMLRQLPAENEMPGLLEDISKTGVASGLTFELFAPQPEVVHDFYVELPINIIVVGSYHQLAVFLSRVAQMSRIVTLHDFEITGLSEDRLKNLKEKEKQAELLMMKITAKIYRYRTL